MNFTPFTAAVIVGIAAAALLLWVGLGVLRAQKTQTDRLAVYGREALRSETLAKPLSERAVAPIILGLGGFVGRFTPAGWIERTQKKLVHAGMSNRFDANAWAVIRLLGAIGIQHTLLRGRARVRQRDVGAAQEGERLGSGRRPLPSR